MIAVRQGTRLTIKTKNNEKRNDNNNSNNFELEPPCLHLELAKSHQVACDIVEYKDFKGLICTDLPGRFPFKSSARNNYIFVLYDLASNSILANWIKSRATLELVRRYNLYYDELQEANITLVLHRLYNKIFDDLLKAIKKKKT